MPVDPIESFQIATTYIAEGDWRGALPMLEKAAEAMEGFAEFDSLLAECRAKCAG